MPNVKITPKNKVDEMLWIKTTLQARYGTGCSLALLKSLVDYIQESQTAKSKV